MRVARAVLLALLLAPAAASAQTQKPIRIIVPFAPGASADGIARAVANGLGERTGRPVVVENNVGGGGSLGLVALTKSPPDGDTLAVGATGALLINQHLPSSTAPDLLRDLAPIAKLIEVGIVVVANPAAGPTSIKDLIARSKARPEGLSYGSTGVHTGQHITMELLKKTTGANLTHIPYRGSAPAVVDVHSDHRGRRRAWLRPRRRLHRPVRAGRYAARGGQEDFRRGRRDPEDARRAGQCEDIDRHGELRGRRHLREQSGGRVGTLEDRDQGSVPIADFRLRPLAANPPRDGRERECR